MLNLNKAVLIGNVGRDPEIRFSERGTKIAVFCLATHDHLIGKNGERKAEYTEWHNIVFFRELADIIEQKVKRGTKIYVTGKLHARKWEDKTGNRRCVTEIIGDDFVVLKQPRIDDEKEFAEAPEVMMSDTLEFEDLKFNSENNL